jgi:hypothetical protein
VPTVIEINVEPWQVAKSHRRMVAERLLVTPEQYATYQRGVILGTCTAAPDRTRCWITFDVRTISGFHEPDLAEVCAVVHIAAGRPSCTVHAMGRQWVMSRALAAARHIDGLDEEAAARLKCKVVWLPFAEAPRGSREASDES